MFHRLNNPLKKLSRIVTRPLRALIRLVRYGHLDAAGNIGIFQFARRVQRYLPIPFWLKAKIRDVLLAKQYPGRFTENTASPVAQQLSPTNSIKPLHSGTPMQPECCALVPDLVSIVLPVYNQAELISDSINSVLAQTYKNFELIIINDGSTDSVEKILKSFLTHPQVRCYNQSNQHLPKALSNGFRFARGEFWTWTSADNIMEPRMLERLVACLKARSDTGMVYADYYAIDCQGAPLQIPSWRAHNRPKPESGEIRLPHTTETLNNVQDNFIGPCFMYRGWIGRVLGDYDPQLGVEDYDYWMRINAFFPISHLGTSDLLYRYRVHDNTLSARAQKHNIANKVQQLMNYEIERADFYHIPFVALADERSLQWLGRLGLSATSLRSFKDVASKPSADWASNADALVLSSETALSHLDQLVNHKFPTAILFEPNDTRQQAVQRLLTQEHCLAFVFNQRTANRVRLVSDCTVLDAKAQQTRSALVAFSKNYLFIHATRTPQELHCISPQLQLQSGGRHVLVQVDSFTQGGLENVVIDLCMSLVESGYQVTILNLGKEGDAANKARECGLCVKSTDIKSISKYAQFLESEKIELVNAHYSIYGAKTCRELGIPFLETIHNSYVWFDPQTISAYREVDSYITAYLCVSKTAAQYADIVLGLDAGKMRIVPNGINTDNIDSKNFAENRRRLRADWGVSQKSRVFLNVASIMATKAQLPLVKAFNQVVKVLPDARLVLLGSTMEPPYQQAIEKEIKLLELTHHVILAGYHRNVASYYHAADVFVLPSYWEGWSLSLGEAVTNGLSCVITNVGSAYEFDDMPNVHIVNPPYNNTTELNFFNLGQFVYGEDTDFEIRLSQAMIEAAECERTDIDFDLLQRFDRMHAYQTYAAIFFQAINEKLRSDND